MLRYAKISAIEYYLPADTLTNAALAQLYPEWDEKKNKR